MRSILSLRIFTALPGYRLQFFITIKFSTPTSTPLYNSIDKFYAQNLVFEIVRTKSVKVYLHMYNGNVQQNPLCVESCVTKKFSIYPQFSPTIFDLDANSVLLRAHLCTAVDSVRRKPCTKIVQENVKVCTTGMPSRTLYAQHPVTKNLHIPPGFSPTIFYRDANPVLLLAHLCTAILRGSMRRTLC